MTTETIRKFLFDLKTYINSFVQNDFPIIHKAREEAQILFIQLKCIFRFVLNSTPKAEEISLWTQLEHSLLFCKRNLDSFLNLFIVPNHIRQTLFDNSIQKLEWAIQQSQVLKQRCQSQNTTTRRLKRH